MRPGASEGHIKGPNGNSNGAKREPKKGNQVLKRNTEHQKGAKRAPKESQRVTKMHKGAKRAPKESHRATKKQ